MVGVPDPEGLRRANRSARSREAGSPTSMKLTGVPSEWEDILGSLADHVVAEGHLAKEDHPMRSEKTVTVSQETLTNAIVGFLGLIEDAVTSLVTIKSDNGITRTNNGLHALLQGLIKKTIDKELNSVELESRLFQNRSRSKNVTAALDEDDRGYFGTSIFHCAGGSGCREGNEENLVSRIEEGRSSP